MPKKQIFSNSLDKSYILVNSGFAFFAVSCLNGGLHCMELISDFMASVFIVALLLWNCILFLKWFSGGAEFDNIVVDESEMFIKIPLQQRTKKLRLIGVEEALKWKW